MPLDARRLLHDRLDRGDDPEDAARAALAASPECVEAWLVLADCATSLEEARHRVRKAVEAAVTSLGEAGLREGRGRLGATPDGADYLHALAALARHQVAEDRAEQAVQTLVGLLAMDPTDPAAVRGDLLLLLLSEARDDEAADLVARYPEEADADWMVARALLRRRRAVDEESLARATEALDRAIDAFPAYARTLAGAAAPAKGTAEADPVVRGAWEATEGALDWLAGRLAAHDARSREGGAPPPRATAHDPEADRRFVAREHAAEAWEASGARRASLARQAIERWPDCVDAWLALESVARTPTERVERASAAVAAGARRLGRDPRGPATPAGDGEDARAYLHARATLAAARRRTGDAEGAREEETRLLAEDPEDVTGAALAIAARRLAEGRDVDATAVLARHAEDASPGWAWARALARRREGDGVAAAFALSEAMLVAPLVAPLLLARGSTLPRPVDAGSTDSWDHAEAAARTLGPAFEATPGALEWVRRHLPPARARTRTSPGRRPRTPPSRR